MNNIKIITAFTILALCCSVTIAKTSTYDEMIKDYTLSDESFSIEKKYKGSNNTWEKADELKQCAEKGNYHCQLALGELYYAERNYSAALDMYLACSNKMGGVINTKIAEMYLHGEGTIQDLDKAIYYLELSIFDKRMPDFIKAQDAALISHVYSKKSYLGLISKPTIAADC